MLLLSLCMYQLSNEEDTKEPGKGRVIRAEGPAACEEVEAAMAHLSWYLDVCPQSVSHL